MARELKIHLLRNDEGATMDPYTAICGAITHDRGTSDPELITCKHCSGFYRTNLEWYSQVKNRAVEGRGGTGEGDLYTRQDVEAGLRRIGWSPEMIRTMLDDTNVFRNVFLRGESADPWQQRAMGVRVHPGGPR